MLLLTLELASFFKLFVTKHYGEWLATNFGKMEQDGISAAERIILLSKWVANGIEELKKRYNCLGCLQRCVY